MSEIPESKVRNIETNVQICCRLDDKLGCFRITYAKGGSKALASGGFGFSIPRNTSEATGSVSQEDNDANSCTQYPGFQEYLFLEEVFFLHERGLLECEDKKVDGALVDTSQFFQWLPYFNLSLPIFLVYAHLRSQDFRVLRHSPERLGLLRRQRKLKSLHEEGIGTREESTDLKHQVRASVAQAPPPSISMNGQLTIAWDVYQPNAEFAKTNPGPPDFYVAVTHYNEAHVSFAQLEELVVKKSSGIPVKLATVSDSGTVVMFGVTNQGVPAINDDFAS